MVVIALLNAAIFLFDVVSKMHNRRGPGYSLTKQMASVHSIHYRLSAEKTYIFFALDIIVNTSSQTYHM